MPDTTSADPEGRNPAILLAEQTIDGSNKPSTMKIAETPIENGETANERESTVEQPKTECMPCPLEPSYRYSLTTANSFCYSK